MGTTCAAYGCTNRGKKGSTVRFHKFPSIKRADLRKKWTLAMKRKNFNPSASTTVCSDHFRSEDYEVGVLLPILTLALNFFFAFQLPLGRARHSITKQRGRFPYIARAQLVPSSHSTSLTETERCN